MQFSQQHFIRRTSPAQRLLLVIFSGLGPVLAIYSLFFGWYALPRYSAKWENFSHTVILISSNRFFAINEEEEIRIAIKNSDTISTHLTLRLDGDSLLPIFISQGGSNIFWSGNLRPAEQIERKVKLFVPFDFSIAPADQTLNRNLGLTVWGAVKSQQMQIVGALPINTAPLPWHRRLFITSLTLLTASGSWLAKEWWDISKDDLRS